MKINKFVVPASTMLVAIFAWIGFLVWQEHGGRVHAHSLLIGAGWCLAVCGLMVWSAVSCRNTSGPKIGNYIRTGLLIVMAIITGWRASVLATGFFAAATIVVGILALIGPKPKA